MTEISVIPLEPGWFGVEAEEGGVRTGHRVHVPDGFLEELGLLEVDPAVAAKETVAYLLDRQPSAAIGDEVSVESLALEEGPAFTDELVARLT